MRKAGKVFADMAKSYVLADARLQTPAAFDVIKGQKDPHTCEIVCDFDALEGIVKLKDLITEGLMVLNREFVQYCKTPLPKGYADHVFYGAPVEGPFLDDPEKELPHVMALFNEMMKSVHIGWARKHGLEVLSVPRVKIDYNQFEPYWRLLPYELIGVDRMNKMYANLIQHIVDDLGYVWERRSPRDSYLNCASEFAKKHNLYNKSDLVRSLRLGNEFYDMWPQEISDALRDNNPAVIGTLLEAAPAFCAKD